MFRPTLGVAVLALVSLPARPADPPRFELTLAKATAERLDGGQVVIRCDTVIENNAGRVVNVRSNFFSAFDGLAVVVRDAKGKELLREPYIFHQSPRASAKDYPLQPGANKATLGFPVDLP